MFISKLHNLLFISFSFFSSNTDHADMNGTHSVESSRNTPSLTTCNNDVFHTSHQNTPSLTTCNDDVFHASHQNTPSLTTCNNDAFHASHQNTPSLTTCNNDAFHASHQNTPSLTTCNDDVFHASHQNTPSLTTCNNDAFHASHQNTPFLTTDNDDVFPGEFAQPLTTLLQWHIMYWQWTSCILRINEPTSSQCQWTYLILTESTSSFMKVNPLHILSLREPTSSHWVYLILCESEHPRCQWPYLITSSIVKVNLLHVSVNLPHPHWIYLIHSESEPH